MTSLGPKARKPKKAPPPLKPARGSSPPINRRIKNRPIEREGELGERFTHRQERPRGRA